MDLWEIYKASKGVPHSGDLYDALMGKSLGGGGSSVWETETAPYLFRQSGGALNSRLLGKSKDKLVGASVGWNQLVSNGNFADSSVWQVSGGSLSVANNKCTLTASGAVARLYQTIPTVAKGHKLLLTYDITASANTTATQIRLSSGSSTVAWVMAANLSANSKSKQQGIITATADFDTIWFYGDYAQATEGETFVYENINLIDLTLMLGSTIADYAYTLESGTAGSGIQWLRSYGFLTEPFYAYDNGSLQSVNAVEHKCVGFNALADTFVIGKRWETDGTQSSQSDSNACTPNKIKCLPNTEYCFSLQDMASTAYLYVSEFDGNENHIQKSSGMSFGTSPNYKTFTTGANTHYIALSLYRGSYLTATDLEKANLNISNADKNGTYEPYTANEYAYADLELRGVFKMDASHNIYADGDTYESSGVVTRKYGYKDLGTLNWNGSDGSFSVLLTDMERSDIPNGVPMICSKYVQGTSSEDKTIRNAAGYIAVKDTSYSDANTFKTAMSGVYLVYPLATPTTETATGFTSPQTVDKYGTEQYIDGKVQAGTRDVAVPVGHETEYKCTPTP